MTFDITINGTPLSDYGGASLLDYAISAPSMDNTLFQGFRRTTMVLLDSVPGTCTITITIIFAGRNLHEAKLNRSRLNAAVAEMSEIYIPDDGFFYSCVCKSLGTEELVGIGDTEARIKATYTFNGLRHGPLVTVELPANGTVICESTMQTDCRLTATAPAAAASFQLGAAVFHDVLAGQVLVFDGIDGRITKNGANAAASTDFLHLPYLMPGRNTIQCSAPVKVEYYPAYM